MKKKKRDEIKHKTNYLHTINKQLLYKKGHKNGSEKGLKMHKGKNLK